MMEQKRLEQAQANEAKRLEKEAKIADAKHREEQVQAEIKKKFEEQQRKIDELIAANEKLKKEAEKKKHDETPSEEDLDVQLSELTERARKATNNEERKKLVDEIRTIKELISITSSFSSLICFGYFCFMNKSSRPPQSKSIHKTQAEAFLSL